MPETQILIAKASKASIFCSVPTREDWYKDLTETADVTAQSTKVPTALTRRLMQVPSDRVQYMSLILVLWRTRETLRMRARVHGDFFGITPYLADSCSRD